jgi:small-conductance mechanosensitive channel
MRPFKVGDRVKISDTVGDIVEKSLLVTRIMTPKNELITIPNSNILNSHIINFSRGNHLHGLIVHTVVTIGYDIPWQKVHKLLITAATQSEFIISEPSPFVLQTALDDFNVKYELNAYTKHPEKMEIIYSSLHQNILDIFAIEDVNLVSPVCIQSSGFKIEK